MGDHLGQHRVVVDGHLRAILHARVHPGARVGEAEAVQRPGRREEVAGGVLGVEPRFNGVAPDLGGGHLGGKRLALGDKQLEPHQVETGDRLGHRVFHLEPGVHLQEPEPPLVEQELHSPRRDVSDGSGGGGLRPFGSATWVRPPARATPR